MEVKWTPPKFFRYVEWKLKLIFIFYEAYAENFCFIKKSHGGAGSRSPIKIGDETKLNHPVKIQYFVTISKTFLTI